MPVSPQIPLQLHPSRRERFEDFVAGPNRAALEAIRDLPAQPGASLFIQGPQASGKTHLLNALCTEHRDRGGAAWYIALNNIEPGAVALLSGLQGLMCFDDLHAVVGDPRWEEALFHTFNRTLASGGQLVATSRTPLKSLPFALPDLASRMAWGLRFRLQPLAEEDRLMVLRNRARALDLDLPEDVERFLVRRISRDMGSLLGALSKLHRGALADKRRVTVPLAREVLADELHTGQAPQPAPS